MAIEPVVCYRPDALPKPDLELYRSARSTVRRIGTTQVPPREARCFSVLAGQFFRIVCCEGAQVGDLNLWNTADLTEAFYSGKTRALHGTHLSTGDRMWSCFPHLRPLATIVEDTLDWYGFDAFGCGVHDVIGTRCDPYTHRLLTGGAYAHCCHSNLVRALAEERGFSIDEAEGHVHDVLNVFMCTGFRPETGQYVMKASPVRAGDYLEFFAEVDLLGALSACPGGDCGTEHSSASPRCHPLSVEVFAPDPAGLSGWQSPRRNGYRQGLGLGLTGPRPSGDT
jgi:uncharacterized protein YcgI (DUF1989 family)